MKYDNFSEAKERAAQDGSEWLFGSQSPSSLYEIPLAERENYLPMGEVQRGSEDFSDCASRGPVNFLEAEFTYAYKNGLMKPESKRWLKANGYVQNGKVDFSDRWVAIGSNTTRQGNSLKAPLSAIHTFGLIPKPMLPAEKWMSFDDYHNPASITQQMRDLGTEFSRRFQINYEQVSDDSFATALEKSCLDVAVYAWPFPENGEYKRDDRPFNHVVLLFALPAYFAFDSYVEVGKPGDFIKKLSSDYAFFDWGYRIYVSAEVTPEERAVTVSVFNILSKFGLTRFFADFLAIFTKNQAKPWAPSLVPAPDILPSDMTRPSDANVPIDGPKPKVESVAERLAEEAKLRLGTDASPKNLAPQELACAESVSNIIHSVIPSFPADVVGTPELYRLLSKSTLFKRVTDPIPGCVVISPTVGTSRGHTGIYIEHDKIASNSSKTGLWTHTPTHYTRQRWIDYFNGHQGLKGYLFVPVD